MNRKKDMIQIINHISGRYSPYEVFCDWVHCGALATVNSISLFHDDVWKNREEEYLGITRKYSSEELSQFPVLLAMLAETLEDSFSDVLGEIYMESGMGNKNTGQFFTPYHLSQVCAASALDQDIIDRIRKNGSIYEPSCGGGGMIIAAASVLKQKGIDYQRVKVVAQDLDWKGVFMCYLQLSLLGINATVIQGNTLAEPYLEGLCYPKERIFRTPMAMGVLL